MFYVDVFDFNTYQLYCSFYFWCGWFWWCSFAVADSNRLCRRRSCRACANDFPAYWESFTYGIWNKADRLEIGRTVLHNSSSFGRTGCIWLLCTVERYCNPLYRWRADCYCTVQFNKKNSV